MRIRFILAFVLVLTGCYVITDTRPVGGYEPTGDWVVSGEQAASLISEGALVLDTREAAEFESSHIKGSQNVLWLDFSEPGPTKQGLLLEDDDELGDRLRALGVSTDTPVIVVGEPRGGWGEDGRISWMLRALGHPQAAFVDGGFEALADQGLELSSGHAGPATSGDFVVHRDLSLTIEMAEIQEVLRSEEEAFLVDTREAREFEGQTPYGESRGGHLPGAIHLHYQELLGADGKLLSRQAIILALADRGIGLSDPVVSYCTGGVRSGWLVAVLRDVGFQNVRNYPGSMWEWAAEDPATHPLE